MRRTILLLAALSGSLLLPVMPAHAAQTCNGLAVTHEGTAGSDTITGTGGRDVISAGPGDDIIMALDGNDTICDGPGNDMVEAGQGDDTMVAEATPDGSDAYVGASPAPGANQDLVTYAARTTPVNVTLDNTGNDGAPGEGDNVLAKDVTGGSGADVIDATIAPAFSQPGFQGGAGDDLLTGGFNMAGGPGADTLIGTGAGVVQMFGGDGDDTMTGNAIQNFFSGGAGRDRITGGAGEDTAHGGDGDDTLNGFLDDDLLFGGDGNDTLIGGLGDDDLIGQDGDDSFVAAVSEDGADRVSGEAGTDTADYSNRQFGGNTVLSISLDGVRNDGEPGENDNVLEDVENVNGAVGANVITGNSSAANVLRGGQRDDTINGADGIPGNDAVIGGIGDDTCTADPGDLKDCEA